MKDGGTGEMGRSPDIRVSLVSVSTPYVMSRGYRGAQSMGDSDVLPLIAYHRDEPPAMKIVPASRWREWMNATALRNANRCLPLLAANEAGWMLLNVKRFSASWSGEDSETAIVIDYGAQPPAERALTIFGYGIMSFRVPYVFRTPPGFDLHVRGPTNLPKDGIAPLDGLVEADWATSTFTMNWKFTRPGMVTFEEDEPFCMLVPQRRHDIEAFRPAVAHVETDEGMQTGWDAFIEGRHNIHLRKFLSQHTDAHADAREAWQGDYFRGRTADGRKAPEHKTKRRLRPFTPGG
jgi:hypothetical protein